MPETNPTSFDAADFGAVPPDAAAPDAATPGAATPGAVIFDLDGVITDTAAIHSAAWKRMFDEFLLAYAGREQVPFRTLSRLSRVFAPFAFQSLTTRFVEIPKRTFSQRSLGCMVCGGSRPRCS